MKRYLVLLLAAFLTVPATAQEFSLFSDGDTQPAEFDSAPVTQVAPEGPPTLMSAPPIALEQLKLDVTSVRIVISDFAEIKPTNDGRKAVFLGQDELESYNGIMVEVKSAFNNPLLRIYRRPNLFPPQTMVKFDDTRWFYYGQPGKYVIEYLDFDENGWQSEFIEAEIKPGGGGDPAIPAPSGLTAVLSGRNVQLSWTNNAPDQEAVYIYRNGNEAAVLTADRSTFTDESPAPGTYSYAVRVRKGTGLSEFSNSVEVTVPVAPPVGEYEQIKKMTADEVRKLNDPTVATALVEEYTKAYNQFNGQNITQLRTLMRDARRAAFQKVPSRNANWNDLLLKIDQAFIDQSVDTPEEFKKAAKAYIDGIRDGNNN